MAHNHPQRSLPEFYYSGSLSPEPETLSNRNLLSFNSRYGFPGTMSSPVTDNYQQQMYYNSNQFPVNYIDSSLESHFNNLSLNHHQQHQHHSPIGNPFQDPLFQCMRVQQPNLNMNMNSLYSSYSNNLSRPILQNRSSSYSSPVIRPPLRNRDFDSPGFGSGFGSPLDLYKACRGSSSHGSDSSGSNTKLSNLPPLNEFKGQIFQLIGSQSGCHYLAKKLLEGNPHDIEMIYGEIKDRIREIMSDRDGSVLIQKFLDACPREYVSKILSSVFCDDHTLIDLCLDQNGTHAIQKLLEVSTKEQRNGFVISVIVRITRTLSTNMYGNHVMQKCLRFFSDDEILKLLDVVAEYCVEIAKDKSGCCVMQQCVGHAYRLHKDQLVSQIIANALFLADDPYGNYVVQFVMQMKMDGVNAAIHEKLKGNYKTLSLSKFGSNVVENSIRSSSLLEYGNVDSIIRELIRSSPDFLLLSQDPFGNYVIQCALEKAQGKTKEHLGDLVQYYHSYLQSHPHGKRVIDMVRGKKSQRYRSSNNQVHHNPYQQQPPFFIGDRHEM